MEALIIYGCAPGIAFPGVAAVLTNLHRWRHGAPFMLTNGLAWREEQLQRTDLEHDKRAWILAERELYAQAIAGTLPASEALLGP